MKKYSLIAVVFILLFSSCEEDIKLNVLAADVKIVIEGSFENGQYAEVVVTRNSPLSQTINYDNMIVKDALVYVSNGVITDTLRFDTVFTAANPFLYKGTTLLGMVGQVYSLTVVADGKIYTATTSIPAPVPLDSVWWKPQPPEQDLGYAWAKLQEPSGLGNGYRWKAKRPMKIVPYDGSFVLLDRRYVAPFGATFDDKYIDGKTFEFAYNRGYDPVERMYYEITEDEEERGYYKRGDTVYIKFATIDKAAQDFYQTYDAAISSAGNPFASPVTIISNIKGGGLGVWAGMGVVYDTIYAQ